MPMPDRPNEPCSTQPAQCSIDHHQFSQYEKVCSFLSAKAALDPFILASTPETAVFLVPMIRSTDCQHCPPVWWKIIWKFTFEKDASGEKVARAVMLSATVVAAAHNFLIEVLSIA